MNRTSKNKSLNLFLNSFQLVHKKDANTTPNYENSYQNTTKLKNIKYIKRLKGPIKKITITKQNFFNNTKHLGSRFTYPIFI